MPRKKNQKKQNVSTRSFSKHKPPLNSTILLPINERAKTYVRNICQKFRFTGATLSVNNFIVHISARDTRVLARVHKTIEDQIKSYMRNISPNVRHSKHVNQFSRQKRKHLNRVKKIWKERYINRSKFKAIDQYFDQLIKQRDYTMPWYRHGKRSHVEYYQQKVLGQKRDRLKTLRARESKKQNRTRVSKNWTKKLDKQTTIYINTSHARGNIQSQISKIKFITAKSPKKAKQSSKKKPKQNPKKKSKQNPKKKPKQNKC